MVDKNTEDIARDTTQKLVLWMFNSPDRCRTWDEFWQKYGSPDRKQIFDETWPVFLSEMRRIHAQGIKPQATIQ